MQTIEIIFYVIWPLIAISAIVVELHTAQQVGWASALAACGALVAHVVTKGDPLYIEFVVFIAIFSVMWTLLFILIKPLRNRFHDKEDGYLSLIGEEFKAHKSNKDGHGEIKLNDKYFRFQSKDEIEKGDKIIIDKFVGVTAHVRKVK